METLSARPGFTEFPTEDAESRKKLEPPERADV
jgi:hypothetical protein